MARVAVILMVLFFVLLVAHPANADQLSAQEIFEGMIYYENDQLDKDPGASDFHCKVTQTLQRTGSRTVEVMEKDYYFMVPIFQLHLLDDEPIFYYDSDLLVVTLESSELQRMRDEELNGVDCYVIRSTPVDLVYARFSTIYYVAKDDYRHVRTVKHGSSSEADDITTVLDYAYQAVGPYTFLEQTIAQTSDAEGNPLHTVTAVYSDYEFDVGLDLAFFADYLDKYRPNPIWN